MLNYLSFENKNKMVATFRVIEGNSSVSQAERKLQSVRVSEGFELNSSRDTEVQLY